MLNFIDISAWQRGLDLDSVFKSNPLDGVIVKATGGVSHVQSTCDPWVQWLIQNEKPWGFYHYLSDDGRNSSGKAEAEFFVKHCENYFGCGMPWLDYEDTALKKGPDYVYEALNTVRQLTGVTPGLYCSLSTIQTQNLTEIAYEGFPLWLAQYESNTKICDFSTDPYQFGSYAPFSKYVLHQYSAAGRLNGYSGYLDLDRFYGSLDDWNQLQTPLHAMPDNSGGSDPIPNPVKAYLLDEKDYYEEQLKKIDKLLESI